MVNQVVISNQDTCLTFAGDSFTNANHHRIRDIFDSLDISENTRKDYLSRLSLFITFIAKEKVGQNTYLNYKRWLANRNDLSISSKNKYLIVAKLFLKEAFRLNLLYSDITAGIKLFKESRKHKRNGLNEQEIMRLSEYLSQLPITSNNLRIKAILSLLIFQGLRQIELVRLNVSDLDLENKTALVLGKGQDDKQIIDLHPNTTTNLKDYIEINKIKDGALFFSRSNFHLNQRITARGIRNIVQKVFCKLAIKRVVHGTRHYFVSKLIKNYKGDLTMVINYTRHKSLATLQVYNDNIKLKENLPKYYNCFKNLNF